MASREELLAVTIQSLSILTVVTVVEAAISVASLNDVAVHSKTARNQVIPVLNVK